MRSNTFLKVKRFSIMTSTGREIFCFNCFSCDSLPSRPSRLFLTFESLRVNSFVVTRKVVIFAYRANTHTHTHSHTRTPSLLHNSNESRRRIANRSCRCSAVCFERGDLSNSHGKECPKRRINSLLPLCFSLR